MAFRLTFVIPGGISQCNPRQLLDEQTPALGGVRKTVPALIDRREYEAMDCLRTVSDVRVEEELISCADRDPSPARIEFEIGPAVEDHARCEFAIADAVGVLRQASGYGEALQSELDREIVHREQHVYVRSLVLDCAIPVYVRYGVHRSRDGDGPCVFDVTEGLAVGEWKGF